MIDREHAAPPAVPDALVFEKYLAGQHVEESASALFESAFAKPMALVAMRDPASHDGADDDPSTLFYHVDGAHVSLVTEDGIRVALMAHGEASRLVAASEDVGRALVRSYPFGSVKFIGAQFEIMRFALQRIKQDGEEASAPTLWFFRNKLARNEDVTDYLHPALETIRNIDADNGTEYLKTTATFLKHDSRAQRTGQELFLHRNAVLYRLKKMEELTGVDLEDPQERAYMRLSFLLEQHSR